jgi:hypothetical protein
MILAAASVVVLFAVVSGVLLHNDLEPTPADEAVMTATAEARWAISLIAKVGQEAAGDLRTDLFRDRVVAPALEGISQTNRQPRPVASPAPTAEAAGGNETRS